MVETQGRPTQSGRGPFHAPPDQTGLTRTNSTLFNPKILEASIKEIASRLSDDAKADLLLYAAKKLDIDHERWGLFTRMRTPDSPFVACVMTTSLPLFLAYVSLSSIAPTFDPGSTGWFGTSARILPFGVGYAWFRCRYFSP